MANKLVNIGYSVARLFGANFTDNKVEEIESIENRLQVDSVLVSESGNKADINGDGQLNVSPYIVDEYGNYAHQLGDNIFKGAVVAIPPEHHEIHCGDSYETSFVYDLSNGEVYYVLVTVPNEGLTETEPGAQQNVKQYHFLGNITVEAETTIEFYEAPTITTNGTALSVLNRNRNSTNTDFLSIYQGATIAADGTFLEVHKAGSGKAEGGEAGRTDEWILKDNTSYVLKITNNTVTDNFINVRLNYYVHPGV